MTRMSYSAAVSLALGEALAADDRVFLLGEDIADGGAYGATRGLLERFGSERVRNTPISEGAIVGYSLGAALAGMCPVAEIMHMDFIACAMDQVVNQTAKIRYMSGGQAAAQVTIRTGVGGWLAAAAQHSQSLEAWFTHIPGLKVATAGSPADIRAVLLAAIRDDDPVIVMEPLSLYEVQGEVIGDEPAYVLGSADVKREGSDVTVVTWGALVPRALEAAAEAETAGISVEVVDLLTLYPWDLDTVLASIDKTRRVLVAHQAPRRGGFGAEVAATIGERMFGRLLSPVLRVAGLDVPVPFSPTLEEYVLPNTDRLSAAIRTLVESR